MKPLDTVTVDLADSLLIEASAGTGKTWTIGTLYLRLVMEEDLDVGQILVVTYTKAATAELRDRIRGRLREAQSALAAVLAGGPLDDQLDQTLRDLVERSLERGEPELERQRLVLALRGFDEATIFTIHGFCQRVLQDNAFESGVPFDTELVGDQTALHLEVAQDFWAARLYAEDELFVRFVLASSVAGDRLSPGLLGWLAGLVVSRPDMEVLPARLPEVAAGDEAAWRAALEEVRELWREGREEILDLLEGPAGDALKKNIFPKAKIRGWGVAMDALLEDPAVGLSDRKSAGGKQFMYFASSHLARSVKKGGSPPEHPFFDACEELAEYDRRLLADMRSRLLAMQLDLTAFARIEAERRKQEANVQSFDDLLHRLAAALAAPTGRALAERVSEQLHAAMIDEFQDTDPVQYEIFQRIWGAAGRRLFLIGDPKQAIYKFRGADVFAYMRAKRAAAGAAHTLVTNWRSDPSLITAVNEVFAGVVNPFVFEEIPFTPVEPAPGAVDRLKWPGASDEMRPAALELLFVNREQDAEGKSRAPTKDHAELLVSRGVAAEIDRLLAAGVLLDEEPLAPSDIAVLCRTNRQASAVQKELRSAGIPSVLQTDESVFDSEEAEELEYLLRALSEPGDTAALRAALTTTLIGVGGHELAALDASDFAWDPWLLRFQGWHRQGLRGGPVPVLQRIDDELGLQHRLLSMPDGERRLTNFLHLAELLQAAAVGSGAGMVGLYAWLRRMRSDPDARLELAGEEAQLRLESDAHAVQLVTIHRSKGLEYGIVFCPFLWAGPLMGKRDSAWVQFHDDSDEDRLKLDIGSEERKDREVLAERESFAENLRLLYVAMTRARHRLTIVWGAFSDAERSALGSLLHRDDAAGVERIDLDDHAKRVKQLGDAERLADLRRLVEASNGTIEVREWQLGEAERQRRETVEWDGALRARHAGRTHAPTWRISSFSGLASARAHETTDEEPEAAAASEAPHGALGEGPSEDGHDFDATVDGEADPSPADPLVRLHDFPAGAGPGTMIHGVLERIDFDADDAALEDAAQRGLREHGMDERPRAILARALRDVLETPLGGAAEGCTLRSVGRRARIDEMEFVLPVAPSRGLLRPAALAAVFDAAATAPLARRYAQRLRKLGFPPMEGFLRGFIDLVFEHEGRFYVVDYKSNRLGRTVADYRGVRLEEAMEEHDYVLQYHLYVVALHRHLSARLPRYDYDRHMGGVYYLFLRGMAPANEPGSGVFHDRPPRALVEALSDLFGAAHPAERSHEVSP